MTIDVCVVGSFMMDLVVRAPRRPNAGETIVGSSFDTFLGGKGFNQANKEAGSRVQDPKILFGIVEAMYRIIRRVGPIWWAPWVCR